MSVVQAGAEPAGRRGGRRPAIPTLLLTFVTSCLRLVQTLTVLGKEDGMQVLGLNMDWSGSVASAENLAWLIAVLAVGVSAGLVLCSAAVVFSAFREGGRLPPGSDFMGFGQPVRRVEARVAARAGVPAWRGIALARVAALVGIHFSH